MELQRLLCSVIGLFVLPTITWSSVPPPFPFVTKDFTNECDFLSVGCPGGWERSGATCFKVQEERLSWADAQTLCRSENANLVSVRDIQEAEQAATLRQWQDVFTENQGKLDSFWIGMVLGKDGYSVEYDNAKLLDGSEVLAIGGPWMPGQPDFGDSRYCAVTTAGAPFRRALTSCHDERYSVCERPAAMPGDVPCAVTGRVIPRSHVCNKHNNCPDASDESMCPESCRFKPGLTESPLTISQGLDEHCEWILQVPPNYGIKIKVEDYRSGNINKRLEVLCEQAGEPILIGTIFHKSGDERTFWCESMRARVRFLHDGSLPVVYPFTVKWDEVPRLGGIREAKPEPEEVSIPDSDDLIDSLNFQVLHTAPDHTPITFKFNKIDLQRGQYLLLYDGASEKDPMMLDLEFEKLYDEVDNVVVTSTSSEVLMIHNSGSYNPSGVIKYEYFTGCKIGMEAEVGIFRSPSYPNKNMRSPLCEWKVEVPEGNIYLSFENSELSRFDKLSIYYGDGDGPVYSGFEYFSDYHTDDGEMTVRLVSSQVFTSPGFEAMFSIGCELEIGENPGFTSPPNGHYRPGQEITLYPNTGYYFCQEELTQCSRARFAVSIMCMKGGKWSKQIPNKACPRSCGPPPQPDYAYVFYLSGTKVGDRVMYVCYAGFHQYNINNAYCDHKGDWVGLPECLPISCLPTAPPDDLTLEYDPPLDDVAYIRYGTIRRAKCPLGHEPVGPNRAFCTRYGTWDAPLPYCKRTDCGIPPKWPWFRAIWPNSQGQLQYDANGQPVGPPLDTTYGSFFHFSCEVGWIPNRSSTRVDCQSNGKWNVEDLKCIEVKCPKPFPFKEPFQFYVAADREFYVYSNTVEIICHPKHAIIPSYEHDFGGQLRASLSCEVGATWSDNVPKCGPAKCKVPFTLANLNPTVMENGESVSVALGSDVDYDTVVYFTKVGEATRSLKCLPDVPNNKYDMLGDSTVFPVVDCGPLPNVPGLLSFPVQTTVGSSFIFTCIGGRTPIGSAAIGGGAQQLTVVCQEDGTWGLGNLQCVVGLCPDPGRPPNGYQKSESFLPDAEVTFGCFQEGFEPSPSTSILCEYNTIAALNMFNDTRKPACIDKLAPVFPGCPLHPEMYRLYERIPGTDIPFDGLYDNDMVSTSESNWNFNAAIDGSKTITLSADDPAGNRGYCYWPIQIIDETPPAIVCPPSIVIEKPLGHSEPLDLDPRHDFGYSTNARFPGFFGNAMPAEVKSAAFEFADGYGGEEPGSWPCYVSMLSHSASDPAGNTASCQTPINIIGHPCDRYAYAQDVDCVQVGVNKVTCTKMCKQEEGKKIVIYGTDSPVSSLICDNGLWEREEGFPDCVEVKPASTGVQGVDLRFELPDSCAVEEIKTALVAKANLIVNSAEYNQNERECIIIPTVRESEPPGLEHFVSVRFDIQRSVPENPEDDVPACTTRLQNLLQNGAVFSQVQTLCVPEGFIEVGVHPQGDAMITCWAGWVSRPPLECEICPLGHKYKGDQCLPCPAGTFQDKRGSFGCTDCPVGTFSPREKSTSVSDCKAFCHPGTIGDENNLPPCQKCGQNQFYEGGLCKDCAPGFVTNPDLLNIGPGSCKALCQLGTYSPFGYVEANGNCRVCPFGYYQDEIGQTICKPCAYDQTTLQDASTHPDDCKLLGAAFSRCTQCTAAGRPCSIRNRDVECGCPLGFTGIDCSIATGPCASNPCYNGGTCIVDPLAADGFRCNCPAPPGALPGGEVYYDGVRCENDAFNGCINLNCGGNYGCRDEGGADATCLCRDSFEGEQCQTPRDPCDPNPCGVGGDCEPRIQYPVCHCYPGYTGPRCQEDINECQPNPCLNAGTCIDLINGYRCECPLNLIGEHCEKLAGNLCNPASCGGYTRGQCEMDSYSGQAICQCYPGFSMYMSACTPSPCHGGGRCHETNYKTDGYECECPQGRLGERCETECRPLEINFLIDASRAVSALEIERQKEAMEGIIEKLLPDSGGYRLFAYSKQPSLVLGATAPMDFSFGDIQLPEEFTRLPRNVVPALAAGRRTFSDSYTQVLMLGLYGPSGATLAELRAELENIRDVEGPAVERIYLVVLAFGEDVLDYELEMMKEIHEHTMIVRIAKPGDERAAIEGLVKRLCTLHVVSPCESSPCRNHGTCKHDPRAQTKPQDESTGRQPEDEYTCLCQNGFYGRNCEKKAFNDCKSPCAANPCEHGAKCYDSTNCSYVAYPAGAAGPSDSACQLHNGFYCDCASITNLKASGRRCELVHHYCVNDGDRETCCGPDFPVIGEQCDVGLPEECDHKRCRHGGTCKKDKNEFGGYAVTCECAEGWTGDLCEEELDRCEMDDDEDDDEEDEEEDEDDEDDICSGRGSCVSVSLSSFCWCDPNSHGPLCEKKRDLCEFEVCEHGGKCRLTEDEDGEDQVTCDCSSSDNGAWVGEYCECEMEGPCHAGRTCQNRGKCSDGQCQCHPNSYGTFCQYYKPKCEHPPTCHNGGKLDEEACQCICPKEFGVFDCSRPSTPYFLEITGTAVIELARTFRLPEGAFTVTIYAQSTYFSPPCVFLRFFTKKTPAVYDDGMIEIFALTPDTVYIRNTDPIRLGDIKADKKMHRYDVVMTRNSAAIYIDGVESGFSYFSNTEADSPWLPYAFITLGERDPRRTAFVGTVAGLMVSKTALSGYALAPSVVPNVDYALPFHPEFVLWGKVKWVELSTACVLPKFCPPEIGGRPMLPPSLCQSDIHVLGGNRVNSPEWDDPELKILSPDVYSHVRICSTVEDGNPWLSGKYEVSVGMLDESYESSPSTSICTFNVVIPPRGECSPPPTPLNGQDPQVVRVKDTLVVILGCLPGFELVRDVSNVVACQADGSWRFVVEGVHDPRLPPVMPPCGVAQDPEITVMVGMTYRISSFSGPYEESIGNKLKWAVKQINNNYGLCNGECEVDLDFDFRPPELRVYTYISRITFHRKDPNPYTSPTPNPIDYLAKAIVENNAFSLDSIMPGPDISGLLQMAWKEKLSCPKYHQLIKEKCVQCPAGTHWSEDTGRCEFCAIGYYTDQAALEECKECGQGLTTAQIGASSFQHCIGICQPGLVFNTHTRKCEQCPKGFYQPYSNFTYCFPCPPTFTSKPGAAEQTDCFEACPPGTFSNATYYGACRDCPPNTYASQPGSDHCTECPKDHITVGGRHTAINSCKVICEVQPDFCPLGTICVWDKDLGKPECVCDPANRLCNPPPPVQPEAPDNTLLVVVLPVAGGVVLLLLFLFCLYFAFHKGGPCAHHRRLPHVSKIHLTEDNASSTGTVSSSGSAYYPIGMDTMIVKRWKPDQQPTMLTTSGVNIMGNGNQYGTTHSVQVSMMGNSPQPPTYSKLSTHAHAVNGAGLNGNGLVHIDYGHNSRPKLTGFTDDGDEGGMANGDEGMRFGYEEP